MKTLILSDIHGNLPALDAVLDLERNYDQCLFLGDVVDYGPHPKECIAFLRESMSCGVIGNHDNALAYGVDCGCRGDFKQFADETRAWHRTLLDDNDLTFLRSLRPLHKIEVDGFSILLGHATPAGDLYQYLQESDIAKAVEHVSEQVVLLGHTHIQFEKLIGDTLVVNPGSVGLARDGGKACYGILDNGEITLRRIPYNAEETVNTLWKCPVSMTTKEALTRVLRGLPLRAA